MKRITKILPTIIITSVIVVLCAILSSIYLSSSDIISNTARPKKEGYKYIIKTENNTVNVYEYKDNRFLYSIDIDINILPDQDKENLSKGIPIKDQTSLNRIIEDLTG